MQSHSLPHHQPPPHLPPPFFHGTPMLPLFPQAPSSYKPQPPPANKIQNHPIPSYAPPKPQQNRYHSQHQDRNSVVDPLDVYQANAKRMNSNMLNNSKLDKMSKDLTKEEGQKLLEMWKKNYFADFNSWVQAAKVKISIEESEKIMNNKNFKMHICSIKLVFEEEPKSQFNSSGFGPKKRDAKKMALEKLVADLIQSGDIKRGLYKGKSFCQEIPKQKLYGVQQEDMALHVQSIIRKNSQKMQFHLKNDNFIQACQVLSLIMRRKQPDWNEVSFIWSYAVLQKNLGYLKAILDVIQHGILPSNNTLGELNLNTIKTRNPKEEQIKNELLCQYETTRLASDNPFDIFDVLNVDINLTEIDHLEEMTDKEFFSLSNNKSFLQKDLSHFLKLNTQNVTIPSPPSRKPQQNLHIEPDCSSLDQSQNLSTRSHSNIEFEDLINTSFDQKKQQILQKKFANNNFLTNSISTIEDLEREGKSADDSLLLPDIQSSPLKVSDFCMTEEENKILENKYTRPVYLSYKLVEQMYETLIYCGDVKFAIAASELIYSQAKVNPSDFLNKNACDYYSHQKNLLFNTLLDNIDKAGTLKNYHQRVEGTLKSVGKANAIEVFEFKSTPQDLQLLKQNIHKYLPRNLQDLQTDKISPGDYILLTQGNNKILGYIKDISADYTLKIFILPTIDQSRNISNNAQWELQKLTNKFQTDKQTETLQTFTTAMYLNPILAEIIQSHPREDLTIPRRLCKTITHLPKGSNQEIKTNLNPSQQRALKCATYETLTLIEGPSGSGKTVTAIEIVIEWLRHSSLPILICAESDSYCDKIFGELVGTGMNAMRVGAEYDHFNENDEAEIQRVLNQTQIRDENTNYEAIKNRLLSNKIRQAQVVCTTSANFISEYFSGLTFHRTILVEACRLTELSCIAPILKGCQQLVLFGDQKGVKSNKEIGSSWVESKGKNMSLFERLVAKQGIVPHFLETEYRMHSSLKAFSSYYFYNGQLKIDLEEEEESLPAAGGLTWPNPNIRAMFVNTRGEEKSYRSSILNEQEVEATLRILMNLLKNKDIKSQDVGVITSCEAQKIKLQNEITYQARQHSEIFDLPSNRRHQKNYIKSPIDIETLDKESLNVNSNKDFIIFSAVRSNSLGNLGSLRDPRRLNLVLSRAKRGLIVIGDMETLVNSEHWKEWINWCKLNKIVLDYCQDDSL